MEAGKFVVTVVIRVTTVSAVTVQTVTRVTVMKAWIAGIELAIETLEIKKTNLKAKSLETEEHFYFLTFWQTFFLKSANPANLQNCQNREIWNPESKMLQLVKKGVLKSFDNLQESTCVGVPIK